ncbi:MAG: glycoside hydrolase family 16 protein [Planctomycetota bacterium]
MRLLMSCRVVVFLALSIQVFGAVIWQDTFDGPSIDTSVWAFEVGNGTDGWGNWERQYYTNNGNNAYIENGNLVIEAKNENQSGYSFTSARMKTQGRLTFKYGTLEARIKIPDLADGLWPAFWLLGANIDQVGVGWPKCGELDIMEMGHSSAIAAGTQNRQVGAHAFWDNAGSNADYGGSTTKAVDLNNDYHIYKIAWTPYLITAYIDNVSFWSIDITPANLEEFHEHMFILLNMAVGGSYTGIYNDNDITASFPAKMYIDWISITENAWTELWDGSGIDNSESGYFGVFTDNTPVKDQINFDVDAAFYIWENSLFSTSVTPHEGSNAWSFNSNAGMSWFGAGAYCTVPREMQNYTNGELRLHMRTTSTNNFGIGISSVGDDIQWMPLINGGQQYGLIRDGAWHQVSIPLSLYTSVDFNQIQQIFAIDSGGQTPPSSINFSLDNIYWVPTPGDGDFDDDGDANLIDFSTLAGFWLETNCWSLNDCDNADADGDGDADLDDLSVLMSDWLTL